MLTVEELLHNKTLKYAAWGEWEKSSKVLPKTGKKHFEPNGSVLQKMQIEKGIKNRSDLLGVERVERISQLATAEWLPTQKKARVVKKSGQDWSNFGTDVNSTLYLIPEEALLLLEMNCLELIWNGVPLSVQQAYDVLIDGVECSLEEYRVYSQLIRYGYRIQRFFYERSERNVKTDECVTPKRKVIVDPENGLRMNDNQSQQHCADLQKQPINTDNEDEHNICKTIEYIICKIESAETKNSSNKHDSDNRNIHSSVANEMDKIEESVMSNHGSTSELVKIGDNKRNRTSKVEIISEETLLGDIKIIKDPTDNSIKLNTNVSKWPGSRIQRNVKLLPRRNDKLTLLDVSITDSPKRDCDYDSCDNQNASVASECPAKKPRHEVIELSDDEIQELPRPMTRIEMLNLIPNMASQTTITERISRKYIPCSIKPQKTTYHYTREKLHKMSEIDQKMRQNVQRNTNNSKQSTSNYNRTSNTQIHRNTTPPFHKRNPNQNSYNVTSHRMFSSERTQYTNFNYNYSLNNRQPFNFNHNTYWNNRGTFIEQNIFQNTLNFITVEKNNFTVPYMGNNMIRNSIIQNQNFRQSFYGNFSQQLRFYQQRMTGRNFMHHNMNQHSGNSHTSHQTSDTDFYPTKDQENYVPSFIKHPNMSSWVELKTKWRDDKTITIDDEDCNNKDTVDLSEIQVVQHFTNPLVGPRYGRNLTEVYEKLRIIKSAPEKTVRRKRGKYKISYNIYSSTSRYKKSDPGPPLYCLVVLRQNENSFIQPIELHRLQQDAKGSEILLAHVSMSISYIQPGIVSVPNIE